MATHRFAVGQNVRLLQSVITRGKSIACEVVQIMPFDGACFQYRIRAADERFDRIAKEHELAEASPPQSEMDHPEQPGWVEKFTSAAKKGNR